MARWISCLKQIVTTRLFGLGIAIIVLPLSAIKNQKPCKLSLKTEAKSVLKANKYSQITMQNGEMAFQELINSFNLNNATERKLYRAGNSATIKTLQNLPPTVSSGEVIIIWLPSLPDNSYGCQLLIHTSGAVQDVYLRHKYGSTWAGWGSFTLS